MSTLYLCEKPSQAHDLASVIGSPVKHEDHYACGEDIVTWASGHLLELPMPDQISPELKSWNEKTLPIIPESFYWIPKPGRASIMLASIGNLLKRSDSVILATDAEPEGELIGRNILIHHRYNGELGRLWLKGLDPLSIQHSLDNVLPFADKEPLYHSAKTRAISDWLVGINATRAASLRLASPGETVPVGRVQTPTLAMVVRRDREIANFKPAPVTDIDVHVRGGDNVPLSLRLVQNVRSRLLAQADIDVIAKELTLDTNIEVTRNVSTTQPPPLFSLNSFQQRASKSWGWTADKTLKTLQRLYEHHKILSYPRTDSVVLPIEQESLIPDTFKALEVAGMGGKLPTAPVIRPTTFSAGSELAHHAIIPTTLAPNMSALSPDERRAYLTVSKSYLANLHEDSSEESITNTLKIGNHSFSTTGTRILSAGWRTVSALPPDTTPPFHQNTEVVVEKMTLAQSQTQPPERYTDGTLIGDMMNIRKFIARDDILARLPEHTSLGTESTRADVIEGLVVDGLTQRDGLYLKSTPKAHILIDFLEKAAPRIIDVAESAIWKDGLERIQKGTLSTDAFLSGIQKRVHANTHGILAGEKRIVPPEDITRGRPTKTNCPVSGLPVREVKGGWLFPGEPDAFFPKVYCGKTMSPDIYARAFSPDGTGVLDGFISAKRNPYSAALSFDTTEKRVKLVFPNDRGSRESSPCPRNHEPERTSKQNDDILL